VEAASKGAKKELVLYEPEGTPLVVMRGSASALPTELPKAKTSVSLSGMRSGFVEPRALRGGRYWIKSGSAVLYVAADGRTITALSNAGTAEEWVVSYVPNRDDECVSLQTKAGFYVSADRAVCVLSRKRLELSEMFAVEPAPDGRITLRSLAKRGLLCASGDTGAVWIDGGGAGPEAGPGGLTFVPILF